MFLKDPFDPLCRENVGKGQSGATEKCVDDFFENCGCLVQENWIFQSS